MNGWRLWVTILALFLGTTIVSTALVTIASELGNYNKSNWIVVSYLFSYTGFLIIYARCSDICGRKSAFLSALVIFTVFSIACGVARTVDQLIVFRALQGIGGAGIYSMAMAAMAKVTPIDVIGPVTGLMSFIFALSSILGPILGGVLTSRTTWRWVFYLNACSLGVSPKRWAAADLIILALEEGGGDYGWNSGLIIASFALCGICWIAFVIWEVFLGFAAHKKHLGFSFARVMLPVFPVWLLRRRIVTACLLSAFLAGFPFMVLIVYLPQRFPIQDGLTPVASGIRIPTPGQARTIIKPSEATAQV
ncbi:multidrug resistance protein 3 [Aspergillus udagawae]|nr:multidrug resistance protein 3 [Aspergillus udagawae]